MPKLYGTADGTIGTFKAEFVGLDGEKYVVIETYPIPHQDKSWGLSYDELVDFLQDPKSKGLEKEIIGDYTHFEIFHEDDYEEVTDLEEGTYVWQNYI